MGITNTIASIKDFFKQWHDKEYNELHKDTNQSINAMESRIEAVENNWNQERASTIDNVKQRLDTLQGDSEKTLTEISSDITTLSNVLTNWDSTLVKNGITIQSLSSPKIAILHINVKVSYDVQNKWNWISLGSTSTKQAHTTTYGTTYSPWYTSIRIGSNGEISYRTIYPQSSQSFSVIGTIVYRYK